MAEVAAGTVLNVNDHEPTRYLVTRLLAMAGYSVIEAATGEEALLLAMKQPDLVVLDIKLPDISGLDVCKMIKSRPETASIFVLQTSATFTTAEGRVAGLDSGADGYLAHPFEAAELIATVNSLMRLRVAENALRLRAQLLAEDAVRKDRFLAMLAHELRNPLAAISSGVEVLELVRNDKAHFLRIRDLLQRQSRHLAHLIDDLLDVSRITRDRIELRRERVDVGAVIAEVGSALSTVLAARRQTFHHHVVEPVVAEADPTRLYQIVSNLVDNASKYTPDGGAISADAEYRWKDGVDHVVVTVTDNGAGMEPSFLPHAFELFAQADVSLDRTQGGLGIGLTVVKRLVELHGGEVHAKSEGPGRGSSFEVWLPVVSADHAVKSSSSSSAARATARRRTVLVAEDSKDAASALAEVLRGQGHDVDVVHDGIEAVERARVGGYDVALINLALPGLHGFEVAKRIRAAGAPVALVALTGFGSSADRERALEAGFVRHLLKPVDAGVLARLFEELDAPAVSRATASPLVRAPPL